MGSMTRWVRPDEIRTHADLALFPIGSAEVQAIARSMRAQGYDPAQPIVLWQEEGYIVDGHTRLAAAKEAGQTSVAVVERSFDGWKEALDYAISRQRDRRNLTRQELNAFIARAVNATQKHDVGRPTEIPRLFVSPDTNSAPAAGELAQQLGVSRQTVQRTRAVLDSNAEDVKEQLLAGTIAPKAAYEQVKQRPKATSYSIKAWSELAPEERAELIAHGRASTTAGLNRQETGSIEWARWSWNPVTGCLHNCPYCYARDIANRFYPQRFTPTFLPDRLGAPMHQRVPADAEHELGWRNIFTCSMADLFGKWVPAEWIEAVLNVVRQSPQWNFLLLTKFPNRLAEFEFPDNAWLGTSVDCQARVKNAEQSFKRVRGGVKWLSIEPMLEPLKFESLSMFDWVVIGGASASNETPAWIPPLRWVRDLEAAAREAGCMVYEKTNLDPRIREYPGWERPEPTLPEALKYLPTIGQDEGGKS